MSCSPFPSSPHRLARRCLTGMSMRTERRMTIIRSKRLPWASLTTAMLGRSMPSVRAESPASTCHRTMLLLLSSTARRLEASRASSFPPLTLCPLKEMRCRDARTTTGAASNVEVTAAEEVTLVIAREVVEEDTGVEEEGVKEEDTAEEEEEEGVTEEDTVVEEEECAMAEDTVVEGEDAGMMDGEEGFLSKGICQYGEG
mmetsp:Transcript_7029/g.14269  ORF Transcript_7029/g.14269 Transcript_7029/m.14269 type:complete len:200 (-) Transcript_7029:75-674(-)